MTATLERVNVTETDRVLAEMFTENTGRHMLDSGGAYGRNWERNKGLTAEDFLAAPPVTIEARWGYVTVDAFHWLRDRLEYDPRMDRIFQLWVNVYDPDSYWLESMETFAESVRRGEKGYLDGTFNTYNGENSLSQTLQFTIFTDPRDGETYVALQVHGGCDVRGGYTAPRIFRVLGYDGASDMLDWDCYTVACTREVDPNPLPGMPEPMVHALDYRNEWITHDGSYDADPWADIEGGPWHETEDGEHFLRCPYCTEPTPMVAYTYPVG